MSLYNTLLCIFILVVKLQRNLCIESTDCLKKYSEFGSFACTCDLAHCDVLPPVRLSDKRNSSILISSNRMSERWRIKEIEIFKTSNAATETEVTINIDSKRRFQSIEGFGGGFSDAAGINIMSLPEELSEQIMKSYFGKDGLEYNMGRVPIAGTDFSVSPYTYDDLPHGEEDPELKNFALAKEDFDFKIPLIKTAMKLTRERGPLLKLIASPWSGPSWMKDNGQIYGDGKLKKEFYGSWANYFVKFLNSYKEHGISFYGVTTQNEPTGGLKFNFSFNQMAWTPRDQGFWISEHLGPQMEKSGFDDVKIIILDDQRYLLPNWIHKLFENNNASKYVRAIGVHWYSDFINPPSHLDETHNFYPHLQILYTEACTGFSKSDSRKVAIGSWERAESYAKNIIEDLQHWVVAWMDWNIALDMSGGPNWVNNRVDSPIIVNENAKEFYKQPMYYALAHFSKVLPRGSQRIYHELSGVSKNFDVVTFSRPDNCIAVIILNSNDFSLETTIHEGSKNIYLSIEAKSINSLIWKN